MRTIGLVLRVREDGLWEATTPELPAFSAVDETRDGVVRLVGVWAGCGTVMQDTFGEPVEFTVASEPSTVEGA